MKSRLFSTPVLVVVGLALLAITFLVNNRPLGFLFGILGVVIWYVVLQRAITESVRKRNEKKSKI
jgi:zinc transporter ZupT